MRGLVVPRKEDRSANSDARIIKRSLVIAGHRTSAPSRTRLATAAGYCGGAWAVSNSLAAMIDTSREGANLSSAIRVFVLEAEGARVVPRRRATTLFAPGQ